MQKDNSQSSPQPRIILGNDSQHVVASTLQAAHGAAFSVTHLASTGSRSPDLIASYEKQIIQIEIKGRNNSKQEVTLFDRSTRRNISVPALDKIITIVADSSLTFSEFVDLYRRGDQTVGFPGDVGVPKSGKIPSKTLSVTDPVKLQHLHEYIREYFASTNDNYLAIHNRDVGTIDVFHTGYGLNVLDAPCLPILTRFGLHTYGGASSGAMRIGMKVRFCEIPGKIYITQI